MTSRQARTARREAERKAAKLARKAAPIGFVPQTATPSSAVPPPQPSSRAAINRANAAHSTGPRSPEGKLASSRNSLKHGLASGQLIIPGEDPAAFDALLQSLLEDHQPANSTEELLVQEIAQSYWLAQRALRLQNDCFADGQIDEKRLALFLRYHSTHQRAFHKALNTLLRLQKDRCPAPRRTPAHVSGFVSQNHPAPAAASLPLAQNARYAEISTPDMPPTVRKQANE